MFYRVLIIAIFVSTPVHADLKNFLRRALAPVMNLSEAVLGETVAASVALQYGGEWKKSPEISAWATEIFNRVVVHAERDGIQWKFKVVNADYANAFAVPGGHIFVTSGLLKKVRSDDELAAVLGHEIGHVVGRHSMNSLEHQLIWHLIAEQIRKKSHKEIATIMQVYGLFRGMRYSRQNEQEADIFGARYADLAGYNPIGMQHFLEIINTEKDPGRIGTAFMSHPPTPRRIEYAANLQGQFSKESLARPLRLSRPHSQTGPAKSIMSVPIPWQPLHHLTWSPSLTRPGIAESLTPSGNTGLYTLETHNGVTWQKITSISNNRDVSLKIHPLKIPSDKSLRVEIPFQTLQPLSQGYCYLKTIVLNQNQTMIESSEIHSISADSPLLLDLPANSQAQEIIVQFGVKDTRAHALFGPVTITMR